MRAALLWINIGDGNSTSVYNDTNINKHVSSLTEIESHTAMTNQPEDSKEKR